MSDVVSRKEPTTRKTRILFMNDSDKPIQVRQHIAHCLPSVKTVDPQKLCVFFMRSDEIFVKVWDDGIMLIKDGVFDACKIKK
jgi:hypothetical protein